MPRKRVMISINGSWNIYNFRAGLIRSLSQNGFDILAVAPQDDYSARLDQLGCQHIALPMDKNGTSLLHDGLLFLRYLRLLQRERPDVLLGYTIKPNIYGSIAAHLFGIPVINNISGLGTVFIRETWVTMFVKLLYRLALRPSRTVFFQNEDDRDLFIRLRLVRRGRASLLPGSGVDLDKFRPQPVLPGANTSALPIFLLIARLLWDKGVGEYVEAARLVKKQFPNARFQILGFLDVENRSAISRSQMQTWVGEEIVEYLGMVDDVRPIIAAAGCVVLASYYREGTPRVLLEAAAMAKPLITTDAPGCRDVVDDGVNGYLCAARDHKDLAEKLIAFLSLDPVKREQMGLASRAKAETDYDERIVVTRYFDAIESAIGMN
ncbi:glycosyltransferase family 4 protein [Methylocapsa sp. D3K7]|uniref:glycosyltransferase family 4 protein n=1 Tax=Methylocapsa sp. D3K7 TaxID=3041435 RepID=UPI00244EE252|nr:glycosyltransferase family 4 protein [Methylocapsa sp. D3K7]WGJ16186.1 glycosyltransferase family 4 protein [Methylocapsa sp. D3K7]